ncbi:Hydrogen cyanide synthase subunit HcnC precursor [Vibrio aerogenes CECT 7868]|uniref:Hydrogen cyanide synthase subunit HcnC n=1 Tax=Vibrio aerogenes CECT 7868 TaxID=1216006 RepID=A0A1M5XFU7_9VIBR|nr:FAD-dependent oxidoreductase [Vibrio aerogenes]SHH98522.1 Hydrogen cyanide synthase subunit HcnC precursor [Vibrio aerogenes CECT 7868]
MKPEYIIIGGGVVGSAVAYGLLKNGHKVTILDGGDSEYRASRGNFGLVWLSCKGLNAPHYAAWTRRSIGMWRALADELEHISGIDIHLQQTGGYDFHFSESDMAQRAAQYEWIRSELQSDHPYEVWDRARLLQEEPEIGPEVAGAIYGPEDGHVNPLKLLKAYWQGIRALGGNIISQAHVEQIQPDDHGKYQVRLSDGSQYHTDKVVLCAGLGAAQLGPQLGLKAPVTPQKGQVLITEKMPPILKRPSGIIRQVDEGGIQIGDSKETAGFDDTETLPITAAIAERAIAVYPFLAGVRLIRSWGALRVISPDGLPIYQESPTHPGTYIVSCHSGITLAAAHSYLLPAWFENQADQPDLELFSEKRFNICEA